MPANGLAQSEESRPDRHRISGVRPTTLGAIATTAACVAAAVPMLATAIPDLLGSAAAGRELSAVEVMTTLSATTLAALFGVLTFSLAPEVERSRHDLAKLSTANQHDHRDLEARLARVEEKLETLLRQSADLRRAQAEDAARNAGVKPPTSNGRRLLRREAFAGAGPGVATTLNPYFAVESRIEQTADGGYWVCQADDDIPESFLRLEDGHPTDKWQLVVPLSHERECLERLLKIVWAIDHYARVGVYRGRPLNLGKLEVRLTDVAITAYTIVLLPQVASPAGEIKTTVLQYSLSDAKQRGGEIAVKVKGALYDQALQIRETAVQDSLVVRTGALRRLLGPAILDPHGRVSGLAVEAWLRTPLPSIPELVNWTPDWPANPDAA
jgi:hypothetical protein